MAKFDTTNLLIFGGDETEQWIMLTEETGGGFTQAGVVFARATRKEVRMGGIKFLSNIFTTESEWVLVPRLLLSSVLEESVRDRLKHVYRFYPNREGGVANLGLLLELGSLTKQEHNGRPLSIELIERMMKNTFRGALESINDNYGDRA